MFDFGSDIKSKDKLKKQTLVVQTLDSAIYQINHYPVDKYYKNQLRYPLSKDKYPVDSVIYPSHNWAHINIALSTG